VVEKRVVPRERVRLGKDTVTGEERVAEELRKEQVEVQDDDGSSGGTSVADLARRS
jgi:stress response protein YsnF